MDTDADHAPRKAQTSILLREGQRELFRLYAEALDKLRRGKKTESDARVFEDITTFLNSYGPAMNEQAANLGGVKLVGHRAHPFEYEPVRTMALYADTQLIEAPTMSAASDAEEGVPTSRSPSRAETIEALLTLRPLMDAELETPPIVVYSKSPEDDALQLDAWRAVTTRAEALLRRRKGLECKALVIKAAGTASTQVNLIRYQARGNSANRTELYRHAPRSEFRDGLLLVRRGTSKFVRRRRRCEFRVLRLDFIAVGGPIGETIDEQFQRYRVVQFLLLFFVS